ncbi:hypothetical protein [Dyadobacter sp. CY323]|uniref:hypothetical protein n=1 Tax=Dyadobacter sp. CY323 TaxID=2907302 RepID=UPI001F179278|nr:hypothetical protein [Dyadobacter sp. CY323]MCE6989810.1 hypothetical protein [Dyadobacter sp. CY323]
MAITTTSGHTLLTIVCEIDTSKRARLEKILAEIRNDLSDNQYIPFPAIRLLHFASFVITREESEPALLIFENNFDGKWNPYLNELVECAGPGLHPIFECCIHYNSPHFHPVYLKRFLTKCTVRPNAYHIGNVGRAAGDIKMNQKLREHLQTFLDDLFANANPESFSPKDLRKRMQDYTRSLREPDYLKQLPPRQKFLEIVVPKFLKLFFFALTVVLALGFLPVSIILLLILRKKEKNDPVDTVHPSLSKVDHLMNSENRITQNHLANITEIKPGWFRLTLLRAVLFFTNLLARTSTQGKLSDISSIHFAHWSIINDGKHLLFLSNYDGSWASYLDDFIDKASSGLTGIWSNTKGFPLTRYLVRDGASDEIPFKAFARNHQVQSLVWYSTYPDLTVQNIDKDSMIRENLFKALDDSEIQEWLKLF